MTMAAGSILRRRGPFRAQYAVMAFLLPKPCMF